MYKYAKILLALAFCVVFSTPVYANYYKVDINVNIYVVNGYFPSVFRMYGYRGPQVSGGFKTPSINSLYTDQPDYIFESKLTGNVFGIFKNRSPFDETTKIYNSDVKPTLKPKEDTYKFKIRNYINGKDNYDVFDKTVYIAGNTVYLPVTTLMEKANYHTRMLLDGRGLIVYSFSRIGFLLENAKMYGIADVMGYDYGSHNIFDGATMANNTMFQLNAAAYPVFKIKDEFYAPLEILEILLNFPTTDIEDSFYIKADIKNKTVSCSLYENEERYPNYAYITSTLNDMKDISVPYIEKESKQALYDNYYNKSEFRDVFRTISVYNEKFASPVTITDDIRLKDLNSNKSITIDKSKKLSMWLICEDKVAFMRDGDGNLYQMPRQFSYKNQKGETLKFPN